MCNGFIFVTFCHSHHSSGRFWVNVVIMSCGSDDWLKKPEQRCQLLWDEWNCWRRAFSRWNRSSPLLSRSHINCGNRDPINRTNERSCSSDILNLLTYPRDKQCTWPINFLCQSRPGMLWKTWELMSLCSDRITQDKPDVDSSSRSALKEI